MEGTDEAIEISAKAAGKGIINIRIGDLILQLYIGGGISHLKDGKWPPGLTE